MEVRSVAYLSELLLTTVYVSATFADLAACREAVHVAARRLEIEDVAMEAYVVE